MLGGADGMQYYFDLLKKTRIGSILGSILAFLQGLDYHFTTVVRNTAYFFISK